MTRLDKTLHELAIFRSFAAAASLPLIDSSLESRPPPEPDIKCSMAGEVEIGFELTEIVDEKHKSGVSLTAITKEALYEHRKSNLTDEARRAFDSLYHRAILSFRFEGNSTLSERKAKLNAAFEFLTSIPGSLSEFVIKYEPTLMPILQQIRVKKATLNGPVFDVPISGWLSDPTEMAITKKLKKQYETTAPLELLAYVEWDLLPPPGAWKASAEQAAKMLRDSQFRRIWIYGVQKNEILYVHPKP